MVTSYDVYVKQIEMSGEDNPVVWKWLILDIVYVADVGVASIQNLLDFNVISCTVAKSFEGAPKYYKVVVVYIQVVVDVEGLSSGQTGFGVM